MRLGILGGVALLLLAVPNVYSQAPGARPDSLALARQYIKWLYAGRADSLFAHTSAELRKNMGGAEAYKDITGQIVSNAGTEIELGSERFVRRLGKSQYWRTARFSLLPADDLLIRLVIVDGEIAGLGLGEAYDAPPIDKN